MEYRSYRHFKIFTSTAIIFFSIGLSACKNQKRNVEFDKKPDSVTHTSFYIDPNEVNGTGGQPYKENYTCNFESLITDEKTPKLAKDIYNNNNWDLNNDNQALALLDSLTCKNKTARAFYFKVITMTYHKADGYFSEALGLAGKEFVENDSEDFLSYFDDKACFTETDMETWANIVMLEFSITGIDPIEKSIVEKYLNKIRSNCHACSTAHIRTLNKFSMLLRSRWEATIMNNGK